MGRARDIALAAEPGRKRAGRWWSGVLMVFASGQVSRSAWCLGRRRGVRNRMGLDMW